MKYRYGKYHREGKIFDKNGAEGTVIMEERRKNRRSELKSKLVLKRLDEKSEEVGINILDVSKTGIGFECNQVLMIGSVYESYLTIWTKEVIHAFLEIRRIEKINDDIYNYGAIFIGMPEMDSARIEVYQTIEEHS